MISINIKDKIATVEGSPVIVCGNSDYMIRFAFDDEWADKTTKTARFVYLVLGQKQYQDVVFTGDTVSVPVLANTDEVAVGVFAGELSTTTPALIPCKRSIRCGTGAPVDPTPDQYDQIMAAMAGLAPRDEWIDIADITTEDATTRVWNFVTDINGNGFSCKRIIAKIELPNNITSTNFNVGHLIDNRQSGVGAVAVYAIWNQNFAHFTVDIEVLKPKLIMFRFAKGSLNNDHFTDIGGVSTEWLRYIPQYTTDRLDVFTLVLNSADAIFPNGTKINVWGLKA